MKQHVLFAESGKSPKWLTILFLISYILLLYGVFRQFFYNSPIGNKPMKDVPLLLFTILYGIFIYFMANLRRELKITQEGFYLNTIPLVYGDLLRWDRIKEIRIENYNPVKENLGIGFRSANAQMAYLRGGQPGIKIICHNDDRILLAARDQQKLIFTFTQLGLIHNP
ncbi:MULTISPECIES: hypothetical protein [Sphingobacterium]|uniref:Bacterial Pleckstrin homology domain-containing protein n=1 Tax=Sphingobacterium populi TaxID=1812824 RepID=A0ABW5UAZ1_9SPHI|nr:hypothetical protein [Sphingobacterium sp. CFCC 11742]